MKKQLLLAPLFCLLLISTLLISTLLISTGCVSSPPHSEFVKTVNFSSLDTFSFKHTLISGMDFRESEEMLLEELSEQTVITEFEARGFTLSGQNSDFFAVVKWKKSISANANPFDHIDPYTDVMARRENPSQRFASRLNLTLEIYETSTGNLFWRNDLPNIFDALQLTEERITDSLRRAIQNFPERIEKDPNLPNLE